jgi:hypothetical protein
MKSLEEFTEEEIRTTSLVLQAIDIEAESFFNRELAREFHEKLKLSESDISNLAEEFKALRLQCMTVRAPNSAQSPLCRLRGHEL